MRSTTICEREPRVIDSEAWVVCAALRVYTPTPDLAYKVVVVSETTERLERAIALDDEVLVASQHVHVPVVALSLGTLAAGDPWAHVSVKPGWHTLAAWARGRGTVHEILLKARHEEEPGGCRHDGTGWVIPPVRRPHHDYEESPMPKDFATQRDALIRECASFVGSDDAQYALDCAERLVDAAIRLGRIDALGAFADTLPVTGEP